MQHRPLGRSGLSIAPIVFGGNVLGWTADRATSFDLLDRFLDRGFNAIDSADMYSSWVPGHSGGESETVLGEWLARSGRRDEIVLMSKVGMWEKRKGLSAANIETAVEDSLRRLQTDHLDVYFAHVDDPDTPLEETLGAFDRLVRSGKVRSIGASNYPVRRLEDALQLSMQQELARFEVLQPLYNLYDREEVESGLADLALEQGLGLVSYFSLASGFLSGKYARQQDIRESARAGLLERYFDARGEAILEALHATARELEVPPAQVALGWLLQRPGVTAPIVSATRLSQLEELLPAAELVLPEDHMSRLNEAGQQPATEETDSA